MVNLVGKHPVQLLRVETDHNCITDHNGGCGAAVVLTDQFINRLLVHADVFYFKLNSSLREEGLGRIAGWSPRLAEHYNFFLPHEFSEYLTQNSALTDKILLPAKGFTFFNFCFQLALSSKITSVEICAVVFNMAETEQYFSSESLTASSAAFRDTFPAIV